MKWSARGQHPLSSNHCGLDYSQLTVSHLPANLIWWACFVLILWEEGRKGVNGFWSCIKGGGGRYFGLPNHLLDCTILLFGGWEMAVEWTLTKFCYTMRMMFTFLSLQSFMLSRQPGGDKICECLIWANHLIHSVAILKGLLQRKSSVRWNIWVAV